MSQAHQVRGAVKNLEQLEEAKIQTEAPSLIKNDMIVHEQFIIAASDKKRLFVSLNSYRYLYIYRSKKLMQLRNKSIEKQEEISSIN